MQGLESVPSVLESEARGEIADIYADIRKVLGTSVVNLIWRNLATMPGALEWTWSTVRPLYLGDAPLHAEAVRQTIALPDWPGFSTDTLAAAGVDEAERALIRDVLDSYQHTNALALVVLSALLAHYGPRPADSVTAADTAPKPSGGAWRGSRVATETCRASGYAEGGARFLPAVRRTSDRAHDRALRADPAGDAGVNARPATTAIRPFRHRADRCRRLFSTCLARPPH